MTTKAGAPPRRSTVVSQHPSHTKPSKAQQRAYASWQAAGTKAAAAAAKRRKSRKHKGTSKHGLAPGVMRCASDAVAASAALAGITLEVPYLGVHASDGASILDTLHAAAPSFAAAELDDDEPGIILGVDLPGAHAVTLAPCGCWLTWGGCENPAAFPGAVITEAWKVTWL